MAHRHWDIVEADWWGVESAARLRPRVKVGGAAALALLGSQHRCCRDKIGGGSGACFIYVAQLVLVGDGMLLGVAHWRGITGCSGGTLAGRWCCHSFGAGMLMSEEEGPDNQHYVEGVEGRQRREHFKGLKCGGGCYGGALHNMIDN